MKYTRSVILLGWLVALALQGQNIYTISTKKATASAPKTFVAYSSRISTA
jgi:hypothetical protein